MSIAQIAQQSGANVAWRRGISVDIAENANVNARQRTRGASLCWTRARVAVGVSRVRLALCYDRTIVKAECATIDIRSRKAADAAAAAAAAASRRRVRIVDEHRRTTRRTNINKADCTLANRLTIAGSTRRIARTNVAAGAAAEVD